MEVRSPYDVINLGVLFGLSFDIGKKSISSNCNSIVIHGETRKTHKGVLSVKTVKEKVSKDSETESKGDAKGKEEISFDTMETSDTGEVPQISSSISKDTTSKENIVQGLQSLQVEKKDNPKRKRPNK